MKGRNDVTMKDRNVQELTDGSKPVSGIRITSSGNSLTQCDIGVW